MTQDLLAGAAGVSRSTVQRAEKGLPISHENARAIYAVLQMAHAPAGDEPVEGVGPTDMPSPLTTWPTRYRDTRVNAIGTIAIGLFMSVGGVLVYGPWVQAGMSKIGHPSQWVQNWSEVILTIFLACLVLAVPMAMILDERRIFAGRDTRSSAFVMLGAISMTLSGGLIFLALIVPMFIATGWSRS